ncbi:MAG: pitrilysin family protein [Candidatus Methanomethylophilaceae archaeon]|jgi:predicted Zn-dependent peptidase|nr:pitrilysin family protein [Candidatus Methanomethylophilaceae archaeon]MDD2778872.1 pitrilysin family protein [Candidatus Methanomethylophilaceae archaeon]MDD4119711.1 pitrilysin family protein [Candidatus Methanomethylophilaceae archaeon]MDD4454146.1 pitrilysin family protein [Candidatus Methanomethylophilaceae archaeon]MDI9378217.1 pitrilysin family protein [Candidatus Thermoplasmatota archaeon]
MATNGLGIGRTSGGIKVIAESVPGAGSSGYMVAVATGSRDETPEIYGISHLLEHVVFRETANRTSFQMSKEIEGAGGAMNAMTGREATAYYAISLKETAGRAKDLVADIVRNPLIKDSHVEMEKKIVLQEINMVENNPDSYIHDIFAGSVWKGHQLANEEGGNPESVSAMTSEDLRRYYDEKYGIPNMAVVASGSVDLDEVVSWAEENFDGMSGKRNRRKRPGKPSGNLAVREWHGDHSYAGMGFRGHAADHPDRDAIRLLWVILGSGTSSRLFQKIREEKALVYSVYSSLGQHSDSSSAGAFFSCTEKNLAETLDSVASVFREMRSDGLEEGELRRAKNLVKGANIRAYESTTDRMGKIMKDILLTGEAQTMEQRLASLERVTEEDVIRVAGEMLSPDMLNIALYTCDAESAGRIDPSHFDF